MKAFFKKSKNGGWYPCDEDTAKYCKKKKPGTIIGGSLTKARNYKFLQKIMTLFKLMYENLPDPAPVEFMGKTVYPEKTFDGVRKYLTVKAGYYDILGFPNGSVRAEAQSLSYEKMSEEKFEEVYSAVIDAALKAIPGDWSDELKDELAKRIINYD